MKDNQLYGSFFYFCAQNIYKKYSIDVADFNAVEKYETLINMVTI